MSLWISLAVLVVGTVLLAFSPHLRARRAKDPKEAWLQLMAYFARLQSAHAALKAAPDDAAVLQRFAKLQAECLAILESRPDSAWGKDAGYVAKVRKEIADMSAAVEGQIESPAPAPTPQATRLEELRKQGPMTEPEYHKLAEKVGALAAGEADSLLEAVAAFQQQYREKTMIEERFHAALWDLLDKPDNGVSNVPPMPAAQVQPVTAANG
jgi:hypothetical protein